MELRKVNKTARKTKASEKVEKEVLKALRADHGITCADNEAHRKSLGHGKKKKSVAEVEEVAGLYSSGSDNDGDNDGQESS